MDPEEIERLIEEAIEGAEATVSQPRVHDDEDEDAHYAAVVVSPAFEGESLVDRHRRVYDALGDHMTTDVHAMEITARTPEEHRESGE